MKNLVILIVFLLPLYSLAQTSANSPWLEKGEIQLGVGFGSNFGKTSMISTRTTPYFQYFIKDRWALRLEGLYEDYGSESRSLFGDEFRRPHTLGVGLSTQYYFLKKDRFALYGQAGYSLGRYRVDVPEFAPGSGSDGFGSGSRTIRTNRGNFNRFSLGVGAQYRLSDRWMLNVSVERLETGRFRGGSTNVSIGAGFRIK